LSNHWPLGLIGIISLGLIASSVSTVYLARRLISVISLGIIASSASTASLARRLISFVSLVGSSTHWLFCKRLTAAVIKATNIGLNGLDDFNGIIGLAGFGLIGCIGFFVGIIGLIMLVKLVKLISLVGLFDCIGEPAFDFNFNYRSVVSKLNFLAQLLIPTSCMPRIKLPSIHLIQGHHMERQSFT
jgi:hypothetical protein